MEIFSGSCFYERMLPHLFYSLTGIRPVKCKKRIIIAKEFSGACYNIFHWENAPFLTGIIHSID